MAASLNDDSLTCCVCFEEYNEGGRQPKELTCSHIACLQCLKLLLKSNVIKCPICRRETCCTEVNQLNTNTSALLAGIASQRPKGRLTRKKKKISSKVIERALELSQQSVEELISKRRQIRTFYKEKLASLEAIKAEIEETLKENKSKIRQLKKKLRRHKKIEAKAAEFEPVTTRCRQLAEECSQELKSIAKITTNIDWEKKLKISIRMRTLSGRKVSSIPAFDGGFLASSSTVSEDHKMSFLTHLIFSVISQNGATIKVESNSHGDSDVDDDYDTDYVSSYYDDTDYDDTDYEGTDYGDIDYEGANYHDVDYHDIDYDDTDFGEIDYNDYDYDIDDNGFSTMNSTEFTDYPPHLNQFDYTGN